MIANAFDCSPLFARSETQSSKQDNENVWCFVDNCILRILQVIYMPARTTLDYSKQQTQSYKTRTDQDFLTFWAPVRATAKWILKRVCSLFSMDHHLTTCISVVNVPAQQNGALRSIRVVNITYMIQIKIIKDELNGAWCCDVDSQTRQKSEPVFHRRRWNFKKFNFHYIHFFFTIHYSTIFTNIINVN